MSILTILTIVARCVLSVAVLEKSLLISILIDGINALQVISFTLFSLKYKYI